MLHVFPGNPVSVVSSIAAHGLTEFFRLIYRICGVDVRPKVICLNSVCALPVSTLLIDSETFQRALTQGLVVLVWIVLASAALLVIQAIVRRVLPDSRMAALFRRSVTVKRVVIALACGIALSAAVALIGNFRELLRVSAPSTGMEQAVGE